MSHYFPPNILQSNEEYTLKKGFPDEEPTLQSKLEAFFDKYGKTNAVRMRRDESKKFKVCVPAISSTLTRLNLRHLSRTLSLPNSPTSKLSTLSSTLTPNPPGTATSCSS